MLNKTPLSGVHSAVMLESVFAAERAPLPLLGQEDLAAYLTRFHATPVIIEQINELGSDTSGATALKAFGYGRPLLITYRFDRHGQRPEAGDVHQVVLRAVNRNGFGREREDDRIAAVWLDYNTFNRLPQHVAARDVIAVNDAGELESVGHLRHFFLLSSYAPGSIYADDLMRICQQGECSEHDLGRAQELALYLARIHSRKYSDALLWRRRLRDLVGDGEGIMGIADSYPPDYCFATSGQLRAIETAANEWRWRLKGLTHRLSQVHGDFHPFNIVFAHDREFQLLDRSRGEWGDPADDVSCITINYLFFALQRYGRLDGPFAELFRRFWEQYLATSHDEELISVIQPWYAWRALVLASPQWYPHISDQVRRRLLVFAREVMAFRRFDWQDPNHYLEG